ncbi:MAG: tRNA (N(6)-L-threonylcarbamoyladenosine(37)-C(2))-methylthiotransferase MtaB [Bdellovibrionales bacterium]|nr:tRNA (N(6)-L-threonylcarbamoyladenosine(37)-C(2))-methylthiotransferase MtaB [Bdellovibrionales bacterium]
MDYTIKTFGCKVNTYDTSLLQKNLSHKEDSSFKYHIINTCAVTENAILDSLRWIRSYRRKNPKDVIVVTGCGSQVELDRYSQSSDIHLIIGNSHKHQLADILKKYEEGSLKERVFHSNIFKNPPLGAGGQVEKNHTRFFLKIQDGCSQFCTFCIIPFARGKSRSLSISHLVDQINEKHAEGVHEVVLTGVHIGDYQDKDKNLYNLVSEVLKKTRIPRIRLSSLEPVELSDSLLSLYQDERMCRHFHLSIQSGSTRVLKNMKRNYTRADVQKCLDKIYNKTPSAFVGMDLIAGFPGETQTDFEDTYELFKNSYWTQMHVFPYSARPKTYALRMEGHCSQRDKTKRALLLRNLSHQRFHEQAELQVGKVKKVLPLQKGAVSRDYWNVHFEDDLPALNQEVSARLISWSADKNQFQGVISESLV